MSQHLIEVRVVAAMDPNSRIPRPIYKFLVRMRSNMRDPALWANVTIDPTKCVSSGDVKKAIEYAGGAAAERLCDEYGDHIDCERAASTALKIFEQLMLDIHNKSLTIIDIANMDHISGPGLFHQEVV